MVAIIVYAWILRVHDFFEVTHIKFAMIIYSQNDILSNQTAAEFLRLTNGYDLATVHGYRLYNIFQLLCNIYSSEYKNSSY